MSDVPVNNATFLSWPSGGSTPREPALASRRAPRRSPSSLDSGRRASTRSPLGQQGSRRSFPDLTPAGRTRVSSSFLRGSQTGLIPDLMGVEHGKVVRAGGPSAKTGPLPRVRWGRAGDGADPRASPAQDLARHVRCLARTAALPAPVGAAASRRPRAPLSSP